MSDLSQNQIESDYVSLAGYRSTTRYLRERILPLLKTSRLILDAGCGSWNRMVLPGKSSRWVGSDLNFRSLKDNKQITFGVVSDIQQPAFQPETFDLIVSNDVVEHLENPRSFVKTCYRLLKENAHLVIATPNRNSLFGILASITPNEVKQILYKVIFGVSCVNEVHYYRLNTPGVLKSVLRENGFSDVSVTVLNKLSSESPKQRLLWSWYYHLCKLPFAYKFSPGLLCIARKN